jgi:hypothetical protein
VIVSNVGAPASFIEPGVTGWVAADEAGLADAMLRAGSASRLACRTSVERFDARATARRYLALYAELAAESRSNRRRSADVEAAKVDEIPRARSVRPEPSQRRTPAGSEAAGLKRVRP